MGISREQALDCFRSHDLVGIGMEADAVRRRIHPEGVVGYALQARIDLATLQNGSADASSGSLFQAIAAVDEKGVSCIRLLNFQHAETIPNTLRQIRSRFPALWIEAGSSAEIHSLARAFSLPLRETIARLLDAGLNAIASDAPQPATMAAPQISVGEWAAVHRAAHSLGLATVAAMIVEPGQPSGRQLDSLHMVKELQEETGGFAAFASLAREAPTGRSLDGATAVEQLKTLAIARMYLDNIDTIQALPTHHGLKVVQTSLRFGANDAGPVGPEPGFEEDLRRVIRDAGLKPAQRELGYRALSSA